MHDNLHYGERKKISTLITVFFILLLWQGVPFAFANTSTASDKETLERLKGKIELLEEKLKNNRDNNNQYKVLLEKSFQKKEEDLVKKFNDFKEDMEKEYRLSRIFLIVIGPVTIMAFIIGYFSLLKRLEKFTDKRIKESIIKIIDENKIKVERAVEDSGLIMDLEQKKIMIIANNIEESKDLRDLLLKLKFQNVTRASIDNINRLEEVDLILFNNEKGDLSSDKISEIADQTTNPNTAFFYLGHMRYDNPKIKNRLNFANSRMQLYRNLINSLREQGTL